VILKISDDGIGIQSTNTDETTNKLGLLTMRERAAALGGLVTIERGAGGRGTSVVASLPDAFRDAAKVAVRS
jgi:signal transduction histidine kinase